MISRSFKAFLKQHPAVRFFLHPASLREDWVTTVKWMRRLRKMYRKPMPRTDFRMRISDGRLWWDFK